MGVAVGSFARWVASTAWVGRRVSGRVRSGVRVGVGSGGVVGAGGEAVWVGLSLG